MQVGDLVKYDSVAKNWLCYGIIKEFKTVDSKEMALVFWHKNSPFTFSDRRERQSWVLMDALTKISETQTMKHRGHGWKRRKEFAVGDLVQWNRWHLEWDDYITVDGSRTYKKKVISHLGIVLEVYRSKTKGRCWTADVKFTSSVLHNDWEDATPMPLTCLVKLSQDQR